MANQTCGDGGSGSAGRSTIGLRRRRQGPSRPLCGSRLALHDLFDSVRRFINFDSSGATREHSTGPLGGIGVRIISCGGSSPASTGRGGWGCSGSSPRAPRHLLPPTPMPTDKGGRAGEIPPIRWRKGEMIGSGAFGQVLIGSTNATREKAQMRLGAYKRT